MSSNANLIKNITSLTHFELIKQTTELMLKGNYQYLTVWKQISEYHSSLDWVSPNSAKLKNYLQSILYRYEQTEQQDKDALVVCGIIYHFAKIGDANPFEKALEIYKLAEAKESSQALNNIGLMYSQGQGVKQDYAKAISYYKQAENFGNASAMNNLGIMYTLGQGVKEDYGKAKVYYEKAARLGDASAISMLGFMYKHGQGVKQDYTKAKSNYEKAAKLGCVCAIYNLGFMYNHGQGVKQNYAKAKSYYEKAATLGDASAMDILGFMYKHGQGVKQDYAKAARLYRLASKNWFKRGMYYLEENNGSVFLYHHAMQDNNIAKAAKVIIKNPKLIKEVEEFDCKHLGDGVSSRESIANLIVAISIADEFKINSELGRAVERLKRYVGIQSLERLTGNTIKEHNLDYSFFPIALKESVGLPQVESLQESKFIVQ